MALLNRLYARWLHPQARQAASSPAGQGGFEGLAGHKYALLTSFRRSGEGVPTPVWFGIHDWRMFVRTGREDGKVKRIRREGRVHVAPCNFRGRPLGPPVTGTARVLGADEEAAAERALEANYGLGRRLYERGAAPGPEKSLYLEIRADGDPTASAR